MQINRANFWSWSNSFWKVPISHIIQNHWKKIAPFWALQFQFNCGTYPIRQLSSLKLPMDSQCIQATSSKSTSVKNIRRNSPIYIARQSAALTKMSKWCFVWQCEYGDVSPYILKFKFFFKNTCSKMTAWIHIGPL